MATEDRVEGMQAFLEKRRPEVRGPVSARRHGAARARRRGRRHDGRRHRAGRVPGRLRDVPARPVPRGARARARRRSAPASRRASSAGAGRARATPSWRCSACIRAERIEDLGGCDLVIEAAPEDMELKRELFAQLSEVCGPDAVLATNTSSLPVTGARDRGAADPERVVGMHFFNPVRADGAARGRRRHRVRRRRRSRLARAAGERMGKRVIVARDGPGFLANRCARPFGMEALKLLAEGVADHATIDRIVRMGGGFRMGPFELADLVGIDVGFEVTKSFWEQSFHEPRWRPSMIQARMVQAGRFGRKAGRGYYDYSGERGTAPDDPEPPAAGRRRRASSRSRARGASPTTCAMRPREAGYEVLDIEQINGDAPADPDRRRHGPLAARGRADDRRPRDARPACCASTAAWPSWTRGAARSASTRCRRSSESRLVELTRSSETTRPRRRPCRGVLPLARQARRVGRRRPGPGAGPDRLPARQRGGVRGRPRASAPRGRRRRRCAPATTTRAARSSGPT